MTVLSAHARHVPADERVRLAERLQESPLREGAVLLHTCHRVEAYTLLPEVDLPDDVRGLPPGTRLLRGDDAIGHVVAVATGLDSTVLGEDQVLHQFREALAAARARGPIPTEIERLCQVALRAGRRARAWRGGPPRSLADVALTRLAAATGTLEGMRLLIVGAGEMGRLLAEGALRGGARVAITSHDRIHAEEVARTLGAAAVPLAATAELQHADGVAIALRGTWLLDDAGRAALRTCRPPVVDLSEPSALDDELRGILGAGVITIDELTGGDLDPADARLRGRLQDEVERAVSEYLAWIGTRGSASTIQAIVEAGESRRQEAMTRLLRRVPDLDPSAREAVEQMSQQLVARILHEPVERLRRDDGTRTAAARDLFGL